MLISPQHWAYGHIAGCRTRREHPTRGHLGLPENSKRRSKLRPEPEGAPRVNAADRLRQARLAQEARRLGLDPAGRGSRTMQDVLGLDGLRMGFSNWTVRNLAGRFAAISRFVGTIYERFGF